MNRSTTNQIEVINQETCLLGECPNWHVAQQKLYWTDIKRCCLWCYDYFSKKSEIFWKGNHQVGGFAFTKKDDLVLCTDQGVYLLEKQKGYTNPPKRLFKLSLKEEEIFNDIIVDPVGRIIAGTLDRKDSNGKLYLLEKGKDPVLLMDSIQCSNGMAFSMDNGYFYHTDSKKYRITKYKYNIKTGGISHPVSFYLGDKS
jgi:D-xylono/L-arabinono-1,4-lactonase